jgi:hypothetical protein
MRRAAITVCVLLAAGCLKVQSPLEPTVGLDTPFDLKVGSTAVAPGGLTIRFETVNSDSRCPINALCIQPGEAVIAMFLSAPRARGARELSTAASRSELSFDDYTVKLTALQPHPFAGHPTPPGDYVATLTVTKR